MSTLHGEMLKLAAARIVQKNMESKEDNGGCEDPHTEESKIAEFISQLMGR